jgi:hypothetical protein
MPDFQGVTNVIVKHRLVAVIVNLSAYLYTWQSNEEVEEKIGRGPGSIPSSRPMRFKAAACIRFFPGFRECEICLGGRQP